MAFNGLPELFLLVCFLVNLLEIQLIVNAGSLFYS